jgi:hypothetical protein
MEKSEPTQKIQFKPTQKIQQQLIEINNTAPETAWQQDKLGSSAHNAANTASEPVEQSDLSAKCLKIASDSIFEPFKLSDAECQKIEKQMSLGDPIQVLNNLQQARIDQINQRWADKNFATLDQELKFIAISLGAKLDKDLLLIESLSKLLQEYSSDLKDELEDQLKDVLTADNPDDLCDKYHLLFIKHYIDDFDDVSLLAKEMQDTFNS